MSGNDLLNKDPNVIAQQMEREMNSDENKQGHTAMDKGHRHMAGSSDSGTSRNLPVTALFLSH